MVAGLYHKTDHFYAILNLAAGVFGTLTIVLFNYMLKFVPLLPKYEENFDDIVAQLEKSGLLLNSD